LNPDNVEWFIDLIELGVVKLPELQDEYRRLEGKTEGFNTIFRKYNTKIKNQKDIYNISNKE
jgi:hypothetical protein